MQAEQVYKGASLLGLSRAKNAKQALVCELNTVRVCGFNPMVHVQDFLPNKTSTTMIMAAHQSTHRMSTAQQKQAARTYSV
jgi:hypothetical protein